MGIAHVPERRAVNLHLTSGYGAKLLSVYGAKRPIRDIKREVAQEEIKTSTLQQALDKNKSVKVDT